MKRKRFLFTIMLLAASVFITSCTNYFMKQILGPFGSGFIQVIGIDIVNVIPATQPIPFNQIGKAVPYNATFREIEWTVLNDGGTGLTISGKTLTAAAAGVIELKAVIKNGLSKDKDFTAVYYIEVKTIAAGASWLVYDVDTLGKVGTETVPGGWTLTANYLQTDNIIWPNIPFTPIGKDGAVYLFSGNYNVKTYKNSNNDEFYYTITGLKITEASPNAGMFANIGSGKVNGVTMINCEIKGANFVGGIAGDNTGDITYCTVSGSVTGSSNLGGITGSNGGIGNIIRCYNSAAINATATGGAAEIKYIGGIAGDNSGTVDFCSSTGAITVPNAATTNTHVGGIVGNNNVFVRNCYYAGNIWAPDFSFVGGIAGENSGIISDCRVSARITGNAEVGGIAGNNIGNAREINGCQVENSFVSGNQRIGGIAGYNSNGSYLQNCSFTGDVLGNNIISTSIGGVAGLNMGGGVVEGCYSMGNVIGDESVGGVAGENMGRIEGSYALGRVNGQNYIGGIAGVNYTSGWIEHCYYIGDIGNILALNTGGVVGINDSGNVRVCYSAGSVKGQENIGGVAGDNIGLLKSCMALIRDIQINTEYGSLYIGRVVGANSISSFDQSNNYGYTNTTRNGSYPGFWTNNTTLDNDGGNIDYGDFLLLDQPGDLSAFAGPPWTFIPGDLPGLLGNTVPMPWYLKN